jgi:hypothetical protein
MWPQQSLSLWKSASKRDEVTETENGWGNQPAENAVGWNDFFNDAYSTENPMYVSSLRPRVSSLSLQASSYATGSPAGGEAIASPHFSPHGQVSPSRHGGSPGLFSARDNVLLPPIAGVAEDFSKRGGSRWCTKSNVVLAIAIAVLIMLIVIAVVVTNMNRSQSAALNGPAKTFAKGNYTIELQVVNSGIPTNYLNAIYKACERWEQVILAELPSTSNLGADSEGCPGHPETKQASLKPINNLLVFVYVKDIDGQGGTLAMSGPCRFDAQSYPRTGMIVLDSGDMDKLMADHNLGRVLIRVCSTALN